MFYCPTPQISRDFQPRGRFYHFSSIITSSPLQAHWGVAPKSLPLPTRMVQPLKRQHHAPKQPAWVCAHSVILTRAQNNYLHSFDFDQSILSNDFRLV